MSLFTRTMLAVAVAALVAIGCTWLARELLDGWVAIALAGLLALPAVIWSTSMIVRPMRTLHDDLGNALRAARDGDHTLRLVVRGEREVADLRRLYNELLHAMREDRRGLHDKQVVLETILQRTPISVLLLNDADRVVYSNAAARQLLAGGTRLDGRALEDLADTLVAPLRDALVHDSDALLKVEEETFQLTQRTLRIHAQPHRLILVERLTPELRRQEVVVWKTAIRVINHEINNSVAPISSLFHSARRAQERPEHHHRLDEIYSLIDERLMFLRRFLEEYAEFARLPEPQRAPTTWSQILDGVRSLYPFRVNGSPQLECNVDRAQLQQVMINLLKNAHESGSDPDAIIVSVHRSGDDCVVRVEDRGRGMSSDVMRQALVPFYTTKPGGSGVGLALSNEIVQAHGGRMRLEEREGGGTAVTCWIPVGPPS